MEGSHSPIYARLSQWEEIVMKKVIVGILPILFLGLLFGCGQDITSSTSPTDISLKTLLPELDGYGFKTQELNEFSKEETSKFYGGIARQFNIPVSKDMEEQIPVGMAIGKYKKGNRTISITIQKYRNKKVAAKELNRRVESSEKMQSIFQRGDSSLEWKLKKVTVSGHSAYYQIFGGGPHGQKYETKLFWAKGLCVFEVTSRGEGSWPEDEAIKIVEEIGVK